MTTGQFEDLTGCSAVDAEGGVAGTVSRVYASDATGQPEWVVVSAEPAGDSRFAPLAGAVVRGGQLVLAVPARLVGAAPWPGLDSAGHLSPAGAGVLSGYYARYLGVPRAGTYPAEEAAGGQGRAGSDSGAAEGGMILSEERLRAGTERVVTGRARLVRYVVTEQVTVTVSVSREEARIELEPVPGGEGQPGTGADGERVPDAGEARDPAGEWMILHAQRPVVQMESVPVERVRLRVETVTGQQEITGQVRREQIGAPQVEGLPATP